MTKFPLIAGLPVLGMFLLTGCIDDNYDLSDIDTTSRIPVNNLVLPLNLKPVTLDKVIDTDDDDPDATIIKWPKGAPAGEQYFAVRKTGNFHSNPTTIDRVEAPTPEHIEGTEQEVQGSPVNIANASPRKAAGDNAMKYLINIQHTDFTYDVKDVDPAIQTIEKAAMLNGKNMVTTVRLSSPDVAHSAEKVRFENLILDLPLGMEGECEVNGTMYYAAEETINGTLHNALRLPAFEEKGNTATLDILTNYIDFTKDPETFGENGIKVINQEFDFTAEIGVIEGDLIVFPNSANSVSDLPGTMKFTIDYDMTSFTVDKFWGKIEYMADVDDIEDIDLSDLPDFLAGPETNLVIENPEISLQVNNPVAENELSCKSGLRIIPVRDGIEGNVCELPGDFTVGYDKGDNPYAFILAPNPQKAANPEGYVNPELDVYPSLSNILSGAGLPHQLRIELANAATPEPLVYGDAVDFQLGEPIESVDGTYCFFTPLALDNGSRIVYDTTEDGWDNEDLKDLHIEMMAVIATVDSDLPCEVTISMRPLDANGDEITILNPSLAKAVIPANAKGEKLELQLDGAPEIVGLDGLHIIATAEFEGAAENLTPDQNIKLNDLKIRVSGAYETEF